MTYATWELSKLNMDTTYLHIMWIYIVRSFGMAFVMMPIMTAGERFTTTLNFSW